ncbi:MAG: hypothetical protein KDA60_21765, partial [Planctomycetales bacterium]|nr:hypothetical protein [Planctomycetales bacterium]
MLVTLAILVIMAIGGPMVAVRYSRMAARERDARQLAEANGRELRQVLSNSLVREAANQTGKTDWLELRRDLLEDAVGYYDRLLDHGQVDAQIR